MALAVGIAKEEETLPMEPLEMGYETLTKGARTKGRHPRLGLLRRNVFPCDGRGHLTHGTHRQGAHVVAKAMLLSAE